MRGESLIGDGSQVSDRSQVSDELRLGDGSQVGDGWRRQLPNSVPIALLTKNVAIQRIVGSLLTIHGTEKQAAVLTLVAMDVKAAVESDNTNCLRLARFRDDAKPTHVTLWREFVVEVFDAVNLVRGVDCEGNSVQRFPANNANEAGGVVRLASGSEDPISDWF